MVRVAAAVRLILALASAGCLLLPPSAGAGQPAAWALVVDTSAGAADYRHEADALAQYRLLRRAGIPDSRIVLVIPDDLGPRVTDTPGGPNLRAGARVDYRSLTVADLTQILAGGSSRLLPEVIRSGPGDSVYVYLAGHGNVDGLAFGPGPRLRPKLLARALSGNRHRAALVAIEACNAGVFTDGVRVPRTAVLAAARADELSHATSYANGIWHADQFSLALSRALRDKAFNLRALWRRVAAETPDSHVQLAAGDVDPDVFRPAAAFAVGP